MVYTKESVSFLMATILLKRKVYNTFKIVFRFSNFHNKINVLSSSSFSMKKKRYFNI